MTTQETETEPPSNLAECCICQDQHLISELVIRLDEDTSYWRRQDIEEARTTGNAQYFCSDCDDEHTYCTDCRLYVERGNMCDVGWDEMRCESCYENYSHCEYCDSTYHMDNGPQCSCEDEYNESTRLIHDYSFRPDPIFHGMRPDVLTKDIKMFTTMREPRRISVTGFELEMEAENCDLSDGAELATEIFGDSCYLKHDGSLSNGFEVVSHPMTKEYIQNVLPLARLRELSELGMRSATTRTCGLHVHINKGFFEGRSSSLYRFMSMFYRNTEEWKTLAGRSRSTYAQWDDHEITQMLRYAKGLRPDSMRQCNNDRYVALNLQPRHTLELRFFKGTLNPKTIQARLEGVHAVAEYSISQMYNINIKAGHDWDRFRQWTKQNGYEAFDAYATTKGI